MYHRTTSGGKTGHRKKAVEQYDYATGASIKVRSALSCPALSCTAQRGGGVCCRGLGLYLLVPHHVTAYHVGPSHYMASFPACHHCTLTHSLYVCMSLCLSVSLIRFMLLVRKQQGDWASHPTPFRAAAQVRPPRYHPHQSSLLSSSLSS